MQLGESKASICAVSTAIPISLTSAAVMCMQVKALQCKATGWTFQQKQQSPDARHSTDEDVRAHRGCMVKTWRAALITCLPGALVSESSEDGQHAPHGLAPHEHRQGGAWRLHRIKDFLHITRTCITQLALCGEAFLQGILCLKAVIVQDGTPAARLDAVCPCPPAPFPPSAVRRETEKMLNMGKAALLCTDSSQQTMAQLQGSA